MTSLTDFLTFTKGVEYQIAIAFLIAFIMIWQLIRSGGKGMIVRISILSYMLLGVIIWLVSYMGTVA